MVEPFFICNIKRFHHFTPNLFAMQFLRFTKMFFFMALISTFFTLVLNSFGLLFFYLFVTHFAHCLAHGYILLVKLNASSLFLDDEV